MSKLGKVGDETVAAAKYSSSANQCLGVGFWIEEERIASRGDVSKTGRRTVRGDQSFSETNEIGMEGINYIKDMRSVG